MHSPNGTQQGHGGWRLIERLTIASEAVDGHTTSIRCTGELVAGGLDGFAEAVAAVAAPARTVIVDLMGISALDADGVRAIVEAVGQAEIAGARVELRANDVVREAATREGLGGSIGL